MNTYIAHKLGEVLAFARVGKDTLAKGEKGFLHILTKNEIDALQSSLTLIEKEIQQLAEKDGVREDVLKEADETEEKVTAMRKIYLEGKWEESDELLEWMGFYTGAALVHWYLIAGAAEVLPHSSLSALSSTALSFYKAFFVSDEKKLQTIGASAAAK